VKRLSKKRKVVVDDDDDADDGHRADDLLDIASLHDESENDEVMHWFATLIAILPTVFQFFQTTLVGLPSRCVPGHSAWFSLYAQVQWVLARVLATPGEETVSPVY